MGGKGVRRFGKNSQKMSFFLTSPLSITRRSRGDVGHFLTELTLTLTWLIWPWWLMKPKKDLTGVTLVSESCPLMKVIDESFQYMEVVFWQNLSIDESCLLTKVVFWWKLSFDESCVLINSERCKKQTKNPSLMDLCMNVCVAEKCERMIFCLF